MHPIKSRAKCKRNCVTEVSRGVFRRAFLGVLCAAILAGLALVACDQVPGESPQPTASPLPPSSLDTNGLAAPAPLADGMTNTSPTATLTFPTENAIQPAGEVLFIWRSSDAEESNLDSLVYFSDSPDVFDSPLATYGLRTTPADAEHRLTVPLNVTGPYFWGLEVSDGVNAIRRPADGQGVPFEIQPDTTGRLNFDLLALCPIADQPALARPIFQWAIAEPSNVTPVRTQIFVSRADEPNPFENPLHVVLVDPPTQKEYRLPEANALTLGESYNWGVRIETADEVRFSGGGQQGVPFTVAANVLPMGELLQPPNGTTVVAATTKERLAWAASSGNCGEPLTFDIYFLPIEAFNDANDLYDSPYTAQMPGSAQEADLATLITDLSLTTGDWAWGVLADDGTDAAPLIDAELTQHAFKTITIDAAPRFVSGPTMEHIACGLGETQQDALVFEYDDGADTANVAIRVTFAESEADAFSSPTAAMDVPATSNGLIELFLEELPTGSGDCLTFPEGPGAYGVELDDGVNTPARAVYVYSGPATGACCLESGECFQTTATDCAGSFTGIGVSCAEAECGLAVPSPADPDCNTNGVADGVDIATGASDDCNANSIPDECEDGEIVVVDAGSLSDGVIDPQGTYRSADNANPLAGSICPADEGPVVWTIVSWPPGAEIGVATPNQLTSGYTINPAVAGSYVFRLSHTRTGQFDEVTLNLTGP